MPRADTYGAYYRESRARLLHQVYAYVGNPEVARRSLADAFVSAGHHWRKLADRPDKDAWMREQAWRATSRAQNRARRPWYVVAMSTADVHRPLVAALTSLSDTDRKLVILRYLAGLDIASASREIGVTISAAEASLEASMTALAGDGIDTELRSFEAALYDLQADLRDEPVANPNRLRREGNRRRRSHMLLVGVTSLALAIGAGAVTAQQSPAETTDGSAAEDGVVPAQPTGPAPEEFTADDLAPASSLKALDRSRRWSIVLTSSDFGVDEPVSACLPSAPSEHRADHYWVRQFSSGGGDDPSQAAQSLEVASSTDEAEATYEQIVATMAACPGASRQISEYRIVTGIGDEASTFDLRYVVGDSIRDEQVTLIRTGKVVQVWVVRANPTRPVRTHKVIQLAADTVDTICIEAEGACSMQPFLTESQTPPPVAGAPGYLAPVDLPLFAGLSKPWVATPPGNAAVNPSATECDQADFDDGGAATVTARMYVVPEAPQLPPIFGMSETMGEFRTPKAARTFVKQTARRVDRCEDRQPNARVQRTDEIDSGAVRGIVWQISVAPTENSSLLFRVGIVRVGSMVAQVTFTPSEKFDIGQKGYVALTNLAGDRLRQG